MQESNGIRATRNAAKKGRRGEEEDERAGRSLRPRKGVSYKLEDGSGSDSEAEEEQYQSESEGEDEKDDAQVWPIPNLPTWNPSLPHDAQLSQPV